MKSPISPNGAGGDDSRLSQPGEIKNGATPAEVYETGTWLLPKSATALGNLAFCRAKRKKAGGFVYCLVSNAYACPYGTRNDYDLICCHPQRDDIVMRTEAQRQQ